MCDDSNCVWQTEGGVFDLETILWRAVGTVLVHKDVERKDRKEKNISSSIWTPPLDLERDGKRDWGKDKRLWPGQGNSLLNLTHMFWANGVGAQGHRQQQQHEKKVFHPDLTSNLRKRERKKDDWEAVCLRREEKLRRKRDGRIWQTSEPSVD